MSEKLFDALYASHRESAMRNARRDHQEVLRYLSRRLFPNATSLSLSPAQTTQLNTLADTLASIMVSENCTAFGALDFYENSQRSQQRKLLQ